MKNKLMIISLAIILILSSTVTVFANTETTVKLEASKKEVKVGETFTVTLKATCPDGINGIDTTYTYDTEKLELVSKNVANSNFSTLGLDNQITIISNSTESIKSSDIYVLTLKVKEGVATGATANISIAETLLDSDAATDSQHTIPAQEITITVVAEQTPPPTEDNNDQEPTDPPADDNNDQEPTTPPADDSHKQEPTTPPTSSTPVEKDDTVANKEYDKAGLATTIGLTTLIASSFTIVIYRKNKKYEDII